MKSDEAIVYAWAVFDQKNIGGRALPSSMDRYDQEYGWGAEDFEMAAGGELVNFFTLGINAFFLEENRDVPIAVRMNKMSNKCTGEGPIVSGFPADAMIFYRLGNKLIDVSLCGIYNTLTGGLLSKFPTFDQELLDYKSSCIFFTQYYMRESGVNYIDLEKGIRDGNFVVQKATGEQSEKMFFKPSGCLNKIKEQTFKSQPFKVNDQTFTIANTKMRDWYHVDKSAIIDGSGKTVIKGRPLRYIVDAIGFPKIFLPNLNLK
ncbi:hypothetical protein A2531_06560 [Candidatus Falkowbacteria bacterium RIFOXYD2_FULL_34_120]|uniref:Uncharacterized protein n=1 Tax=Candidatus Falkowbacteria bacterium RIFOXYD2_FULL_34_120 TaxID=1798007 RepID=A0A1F5TMV5_9BACT|nr:MAG: hypothetical protein A2500_05040 [Candidatus Falkowbacteria bacterium RIFOXYC12_FULL_34_55]OGF38001.1 MAG: hypothetical protein A2466_03750 [Candidatus Falkowbacteria bacterium RIFOXYC2_FULL_34_220]OGF38256.1 MAG: hypothetical protein A2515_00660 [Candidatus Falkowbacteria bacterium RIFOXYD12_FULL_34_57]OGF40177.1 MAG: hypothetical protein A2531_06560 [Candidatus Falkowbacteria bacterium RIFOXYD2_FULL_34_120]